LSKVKVTDSHCTYIAKVVVVWKMVQDRDFVTTDH